MQIKGALPASLTCCTLALIVSACGSSGKDYATTDVLQRSSDNPNCVLRKSDDPELAKLAIKARKEWPRFCKAFDAKSKNKEMYFVVKGPFTEGEETEHFWLDVTAIDGNTIKGTHNEDGLSIKSIHEGDAATLPADQIEDWIFDDGKTAAGGFSILYFAPGQFGPMNGIDPASEDAGAKAKKDFDEHWAQIWRDMMSKKDPDFTEADASTVTFFYKLVRLCKGNDGADPSAQKMAEITHLPLETAKCMLALVSVAAGKK